MNYKKFINKFLKIFDIFFLVVDYGDFFVLEVDLFKIFGYLYN